VGVSEFFFSLIETNQHPLPLLCVLPLRPFTAFPGIVFRSSRSQTAGMDLAGLRHLAGVSDQRPRPLHPMLALSVPLRSDLWLWHLGRLHYMRRSSRPISVCFTYGDSPTFLRIIGRLYLASR
jgi:hypothetical protein